MLGKLKSAIDPTTDRPSLQKAKIKAIDIKGKEIMEIECQFNPQSMTISKTVEWAAAKAGDDKKEAQPQLNAPTLGFGGGNPAEFSLDLVFDTTTMDNQDVRGFTNQLLSLTLMGAGDPKRSEEDPPMVQFVWGEFILFFAVIIKIEISFTLFLASGVPVRARAKVNFKQRVDEDGKLASQNPTTRTAARKTHVVQQGDRMDYLAYQE
ncbi:MAG: hypothetical protein MUO76_02155, partial [Anaerolineaceae bacterium]|nr:hypothetical protein [Anaerolineaceae bacterium]